MIVQCRVCKKIRDKGHYRHPWPGELPMNVTQTYCPDCAQETLATLQKGQRPFIYEPLARPAAVAS